MTGVRHFRHLVEGNAWGIGVRSHRAAGASATPCRGYRRPHRIVPLSHHGLGRECRDREGAVNSSVLGRLPPGRPGPELPHDSVEHRQVVQMRATSADRQPADPQADRFALGHRGEGPARAVRGGQAAVRCEVRQMSAFTIRRQSRARWSSTSATPLPSRPYLQGTWATTRVQGRGRPSRDRCPQTINQLTTRTTSHLGCTSHGA
jgi:hypothetical protein